MKKLMILKKIGKSLVESGLLIKGVTETIKNEAFLGMLIETLGASLLGNLSIGKAAIRVNEGNIRAGENL